MVTDSSHVILPSWVICHTWMKFCAFQKNKIKCPRWKPFKNIDESHSDHSSSITKKKIIVNLHWHYSLVFKDHGHPFSLPSNNVCMLGPPILPLLLKGKCLRFLLLGSVAWLIWLHYLALIFKQEQWPIAHLAQQIWNFCSYSSC